MTTMWAAVILLSCSYVTWTQASITSQVVSTPGNLNFTCDVLDTTPTAANASNDTYIFLQHGFPMGRGWYAPLLQYLQAEWPLETRIKAVACDLRGYSTEASPECIQDYDYEILAQDSFDLARAFGMMEENSPGFHLIGHDHGALLGWVVASLNKEKGQGKILSYTAMSVTHLDAMNSALCSGNGRFDPDQVIATNYFNQFRLPDSAMRNDNALFNLFSDFGLPVASPQAFQKQLWWYHGSIPKFLTAPRILTAQEISNLSGPQYFFAEAVYQAVPLKATSECLAVEETLNPIDDMPVFFVCGAQDPYLLCTKPWNTPPMEMVTSFTSFTAPSCGHDFFLPGECQNASDTVATMQAMTDFLVQVASNVVPTPPCHDE